MTEQFLQSDNNLRNSYNFDIGRVIFIYKDALVETISNEASLEKDLQMNGRYRVQLQTSDGILDNVVAFGEGYNNFMDIVTYPLGCYVLIGYLGKNKMPFIVRAVPLSRKDAQRGSYDKGIEIPLLQPGEFYRSTPGRAIFHMTKDGIVEMTGTFSDQGYPVNMTILVGGNLGNNSVTNNMNLFTISKQNVGTILSVDSKGNVVNESNRTIYTRSSDEDKRISNNSNTTIGHMSDKEDEKYADRTGSKTIKVGKNFNVKAGRVNIYSIDLEKQDGKITLGKEDKASENAILGQQFIKALGNFLDGWISNSDNIGTGNLGAAVPINPSIATAIIRLQDNLLKMLSKKTFLEKDNEVI